MASGAYTGDISAEMLKDAGAAAVIVGHSERRRDHGETDAAVRAKALAAKRAGLLAIVCVGETRAEREAGATLAVVGAQLDGSLPDDPADVVVAYEPVWAIGTGLTPTAADVGEVHRSIRERLGSRYGQAGQGIRILYGGSVNAGEREGTLGGRERRRRAGWRREPQARRIPGDRRGLPLGRLPRDPGQEGRKSPRRKRHGKSASDHVETPATSYIERRRARGRKRISSMLTVVIVIHLMLVVAMIGVVLLQKSEGGGLVSSTSGFMTGRGTANVLTRTTALLAVGFFVTSLALSWLAGLGHKPASHHQSAARRSPRERPAPVAPLSQSGSGVLDQLRGNAPAAPRPGAQRAASAAVEIGSKTHGASDFGPDACDDQSQTAFDAA